MPSGMADLKRHAPGIYHLKPDVFKSSVIRMQIMKNQQ